MQTYNNTLRVCAVSAAPFVFMPVASPIFTARHVSLVSRDHDFFASEIMRMTPPNNALLELARLSPPPQEWFDSDESLFEA